MAGRGACILFPLSPTGLQDRGMLGESPNSACQARRAGAGASSSKQMAGAETAGAGNAPTRGPPPWRPAAFPAQPAAPQTPHRTPTAPNRCGMPAVVRAAPACSRRRTAPADAPEARCLPRSLRPAPPLPTAQTRGTGSMLETGACNPTGPPRAAASSSPALQRRELERRELFESKACWHHTHEAR